MSIASATSTDLVLSVEVQDVIREMAWQVALISADHGPHSKAFHEAAISFVRMIDNMMRPGLSLWPDCGDANGLSLSGERGGNSFGLTWHPEPRQCTHQGRDGRSSKDQTTGTVTACRFADSETIAEHEHQGGIPGYLATPGSWARHD